jgi:hypothetical protein
MTNAHAHRQHRNQRLRSEVSEIIDKTKDGEILKTSDLVTRLGKGKLEPSSRTIGRMIAEHCPDEVEHAGTGHWVRRVRVVEA